MLLFIRFGLCFLILIFMFFAAKRSQMQLCIRTAERPPVILSSLVSSPNSLLPLDGREILTLSAMILNFWMNDLND
jgi:hypothetical protein